MKPIRKRCHNCIFYGTKFKIAGKIHAHCERVQYTEEQYKSGEVSPWDTVKVFYETCKNHLFRQ